MRADADVDKLMRSILFQEKTIKEKDFDLLVSHLEAVAGDENVAAVLKKLNELEKDTHK